MSEEPLNESLKAVEAALAGLRVKPTSVDRDRMMFLAGQASLRHDSPLARAKRKGRMTRAAGWFWPLATAVSLLLAATLGGILLHRAGPTVVDRVVYVPVDRPEKPAAGHDAPLAVSAQSPESPLRSDYLVLRQWILTRGVDALPQSASDESRSPQIKMISPRDAYGASVEADRSG
jgi:hypothetical protein